MKRRGVFRSLGGVLAGLAAGRPVEAAAPAEAARPVARAGLVVVRVDEATEAKILAGPTGKLKNGHGARTFEQEQALQRLHEGKINLPGWKGARKA